MPRVAIAAHYHADSGRFFAANGLHGVDARRPVEEPRMWVTAAGARAVSSHLGQRRDAAGVIVDPALRDLEAVGLLAMRAVEINGPAARARDAGAIGVDAGLDLARCLRAQEYQFAHATLPKKGPTHSTGYGGHGELRPRAAIACLWICG